jgi:hypothetical protein
VLGRGDVDGVVVVVGFVLVVVPELEGAAAAPAMPTTAPPAARLAATMPAFTRVVLLI